MFWLELHKLRWKPALASFLLAWPVAQNVSGLDLAPNGNRADKSGYTLWNPTPASLMRELSADRPDKTDSAYTVDAGHYQLEIDAVNWTLDRHNPERRNVRLSVTEIAAANIKLGILNQLDVQLVLPAWHDERARDFTSGTIQGGRGFTDLVPRFKLNLWGNDGGATALALLPFVKIPTASRGIGNSAWEGGVKFPFAIDTPGWDVSAMTEFDWFRNQRSSGRHAEFANSLSIGREVLGKLSLYGEFYSSVSTEPSAPWVGTFNTWLTYQCSANVRVDAGVYIGLTRAAPDWHPFVGLTWRY